MAFTKIKKKHRWQIPITIVASFIILFSGAYLFVLANKKAILENVTDKLNRQLSGKISIGDIDFTMFHPFPALTIRLKNIQVTDSLVSQQEDTLVRAKDF